VKSLHAKIGELTLENDFLSSPPDGYVAPGEHHCRERTAAQQRANPPRLLKYRKIYDPGQPFRFHGRALI
jgi:hypothetical protein